MNSDKRFYWIKLKTDFFNRADIDFLISQKNGCEYALLYIMLCLNTANNDGKLQTTIGEVIVPYNAEKIARDCKYFSIDTINVGMSLYKRMGLIYEEEDGTLKISKYDEMVGSESGNANAQRQKRFRERQKQLKLTVTNSNEDSNTDNNEEKDIRDKSIEKNNLEIEKEKKTEIISKRNNKSINNAQLVDEFEKIWKLYPRKQSKKKALEYYKGSRNKGATYEEVMEGLIKYNDYIRAERIDVQFIKHGSTWFYQECWNDEYMVARKKTLKDISMADIDEAIRLEREGKNHN